MPGNANVRLHFSHHCVGVVNYYGRHSLWSCILSTGAIPQMRPADEFFLVAVASVVIQKVLVRAVNWQLWPKKWFRLTKNQIKLILLFRNKGTASLWISEFQSTELDDQKPQDMDLLTKIFSIFEFLKHFFSKRQRIITPLPWFRNDFRNMNRVFHLVIWIISSFGCNIPITKEMISFWDQSINH